MVEIILKQFSIEDAITAAVASPITQTQTLNHERLQAQEAAESAITRQLQKELNTYLEADFQKSLNCNIVTPKQLNVFAAFARFGYKENDFTVGRNADEWTITFNHKTINCAGADLKNTILVELGYIREQSKLQPDKTEEVSNED